MAKIGEDLPKAFRPGSVIIIPPGSNIIFSTRINVKIGF